MIASALMLCAGAAAHDIPADVTVRMFLKPEGRTLHVLVRVPMAALRDVDVRELRPGVTDLPRLQAQLPDAATVWLGNFIRLEQDGRELPHPRVTAVRMALESDRAFASYDEAAAALRGPGLPQDTQVVWNQLLADVALEVPISSERARFSIDPQFRGLAAHVLTTLRFLPPGGAERAYEFTGDPGLVELDPAWYRAAGRFVALGFRHILDGTDHLLFLLCLVIPLRRLKPLVLVVTAFTVAHSVTLIASALNLAPDALWFPPMVEFLIAVSIVYMGLENIVTPGVRPYRWMVALGFGLVHGFGFSFALRQTLQFAGTHLITSLLAFNLGVELGQLAVLAVLVPALSLLFRYVVAERTGIIVVSALVVHTALHWTGERWTVLGKYGIGW